MNTLRIGNIEAKVPIVQGGMGVAVSLSGLASAVANAGGIGIISAAGIGMREPDYNKNFRNANKTGLRKELQKARSLTKGIIGVNIMMALTDHEELIKVAIDEKADLVIMGAGLPLKIPAMLAEAGYKDFHTRLVVKVSSGKAAKLIFQYWANKYNRVPDAVVVEGPLAGGHLGFKRQDLVGDVVPLKKLIEDTVAEVRVFEQQFNMEIPVIAAGGIYTGKDMYDIMQAGAKAVKLGTRFVTTHECDVSMEFKESYIKCSEKDITLISSPVGLPGRVVRNNFVDEIEQGHTKPFKCVWNCLSSCNYKEAPYCIAQVLLNSANGKMGDGFAFAGSNAYRATKIEHVSDIVDELVLDYNREDINHQMEETRRLAGVLVGEIVDSQ